MIPDACSFHSRREPPILHQTFAYFPFSISVAQRKVCSTCRAYRHPGGEGTQSGNGGVLPVDVDVMEGGAKISRLSGSLVCADMACVLGNLSSVNEHVGKGGNPGRMDRHHVPALISVPAFVVRHAPHRLPRSWRVRLPSRQRPDRSDACRAGSPAWIALHHFGVPA